jgi:hypothetical protein
MRVKGTFAIAIIYKPRHAVAIEDRAAAHAAQAPHPGENISANAR